MSSRRDSIRVFLRIRPERFKRQYEQRFTVEHTFDNSAIQFHVDRRTDNDFINNSVQDYRFTFDRVFEPKTTQEDIFNMVAKDCVMSALDGFNSTIFAYGQTGSGKTFTITGGTESYQDRGIIPRTLSLVYEEIAKRTDFEWTVRISYLQIYNDKGSDLLNRGKDARSLDDLPVVTVRESDDEVVLKGLEAHTSSSVNEALNLLFLGDTNRLYSETPQNKTSSRSHCVFTISLEARGHGTAVVRRSKLNLVDLAGSERPSKTGVTGTLLNEAKYINESLHFLEHVIISLSEHKDHIPYRNSMMTMVLRDSLGGNCRTAMLATSYPTDDMFMETISTCRFAQRVAQIKQNARVNEETDPAILVRKLRAEVAQLKEQLSFYTKSGQSDEDRALTSDELQRCQEIVTRFVDDPDPNTQITGLGGDLARVLACFAIMKTMIRSSGGKKMSAAEAAAALGRESNTAADRPSSRSPPPSSSGGMNSEQAQKLQSQIEALNVALQQKENELSLFLNIVEKHNVPKFNVQTQTYGYADESAGYYNRGPTPPERVTAQAAASDNVMGMLARSTSGMQPTQPPAQRQVSTANLSAAQAQVAAEFLQRQDELRDSYDLSALTDADMLKDRAAAFEAFRRSYRKFEQVEKNKLELKELYSHCQALAAQVNGYSDDVKKWKTRIQQLRAERALQGGSEPDADEVTALANLDRVKQQYIGTAKELAQGREQVNTIHLMMMRAQEQLTKDFEDWFSLRQKQVILAQQNGPVASSSSSLPPVTQQSLRTSTTGPTLSQPSQSTSASQSFVAPLPSIVGASRTPPDGLARSQGVGGSMVSSSVMTMIQNSQQQRPTVSSAPNEGRQASAVVQNQLSSTALPARGNTSGLSYAAVAPPPMQPAPQIGNFVQELHQRNQAEHQLHGRMMDSLESRNPYAPEYPSTGNAEADAQLAQMYKAREEMHRRLMGGK